MRYHFMHVRMTIIKKSKDNIQWQGCEEKISLYIVHGDATWYSHDRKMYGISSKIKKRTIILSSNPISKYISEENKIITLKKYLYSYVHCCIIYNSQGMEET